MFCPVVVKPHWAALRPLTPISNRDMQGILVKARSPGRRCLTTTGVYRPIAEKVESRRGESGRAWFERSARADEIRAYHAMTDYSPALIGAIGEAAGGLGVSSPNGRGVTGGKSRVLRRGRSEHGARHRINASTLPRQ